MKSSAFTYAIRWLFTGSMLVGVLGALSTPAHASEPKADPLIERGRYLVEQTGMCADCHSPRGERGAFIKERWLQGAPLGFAPTVPMPAFASVALPIAGLPSMTVEAGKRFLMTGLRADGTRTRPPMPEYRFNEEDATAMVAYLKTLKAGPAEMSAPTKG